MRIELILTDAEFIDLQHACEPVPYLVMNGREPLSPRQNANIFWQALGRKRGFKWESARPVPGKTGNVVSVECEAREVGDG